MTAATSVLSTALAGVPGLRDRLADLYRDLHSHPELSGAEHRTAAILADRAAALGCSVTDGVGGTGVVAVLANGSGPTVLLRADIDALPVTEATGLSYASGTDGVMHACGHDLHATCLLGALELLAGSRSGWSGTVLAVFQPAEETGTGAQAMIDDRFYHRFATPDVVLAQHTGPFPVGVVGTHSGPFFAATDALRVVLHGKGGHGSRPEATVDPVVMAAATVMRLQTVVSREIPAGDAAVVTVGSLHAGTTHNVIPDDAELQLNIRTFDPAVRSTVLAAVHRIVKAEAVASGAQWDPEISEITTFPVLSNDEAAVEKTSAALAAVFGRDRIIDPGRVTGSEDAGIFATEAGVPLCYWLFGVLDPARFGSPDPVAGLTALLTGTIDAKSVPSPHSATYAPSLDAIDVGVTAMTTAALAWLDPSA
ncbi:amidohydrolase [Nocardia stercoris]|uniref:Amidohydrolase n=1 Tax=Nocardia stercoris TaxID=2483361 RepID=A0A3M2LDN0_9NOCA|nr:amidohydrolase [Nocardia stercoris]RMI35631.1 amidohydrolase [Nocardia stercoris]